MLDDVRPTRRNAIEGARKQSDIWIRGGEQEDDLMFFARPACWSAFLALAMLSFAASEALAADYEVRTFDGGPAWVFPLLLPVLPLLAGEEHLLQLLQELLPALW